MYIYICGCATLFLTQDTGHTHNTHVQAIYKTNEKKQYVYQFGNFVSSTCKCEIDMVTY